MTSKEAQADDVSSMHSAFKGHQSLLSDSLMLGGKETHTADSFPEHAASQGHQSHSNESLRVQGSLGGKRKSNTNTLPMDVAVERQESLLGGSEQSLSGYSQWSVWEKQVEDEKQNQTGLGPLEGFERERRKMQNGWDGKEINGQEGEEDRVKLGLRRKVREEREGRKERKEQEFATGQKNEKREREREGQEKRKLEYQEERRGKEREERTLENKPGQEGGRQGRDSSITLGTLNPSSDDSLSLTIGLDSMFDTGTSLLTSLLGVAAVLGIIGIGAGLIAAVAAGW